MNMSPAQPREPLEFPVAHPQYQRVALEVFRGQLLVRLVLLRKVLRNALQATLDGALGVDRSDPQLTARVRELAHGGTSDIARAVRNALRMLSQRRGAKAMTLVSDGAQASAICRARRSPS